MNLPVLEARFELEGYLGRSLEPGGERWRGTATRTATARQSHRSAAAVVLATHLERAGLAWRVLDPGARGLGYFRRHLETHRAAPPRAVAICTTFIVSAPWLRLLCLLVRRTLPSAKLLVGGYYYGTSARDFLSLDADVLCVGEGEARMPDIVAAIRDGAEARLRAIPGLYLRQPDGSLLHTGPAKPLDLETLPFPDWRLAERIDPPVRLDDDPLVYVAETQRGCVFKCEYCTYRTLAHLKVMSATRAADLLTRIAPGNAAPGSTIDVVDATATYPRERWESLMRVLAERGGSRLPISAYARVTDISDGIAELMGRANVRRVFIGQESGDQGVLNLMKKGTKVTHIKPAVWSLWRNGIDPVLSFVHGFPGETEASLSNTRRLLEVLNDGGPAGPACALYTLQPFSLYDFASVSQAPSMEGVSHYLGWKETGGLTVDRVIEEVIGTIIRLSRTPNAPACESVLDWSRIATGGIKERLLTPERTRVFRWLKSIERGIAIFVERSLEGTPPNANELRSIRTAILEELPAVSRVDGWAARARARGALTLARRMRTECANESDRGIGPVTRALIAAMLARDLGDPRFALRPPIAGIGTAEPPPAPEVDRLADDMVSTALRRRKIDVAGLQTGRV
jgi:hypothetical protein